MSFGARRLNSYVLLLWEGSQKARTHLLLASKLGWQVTNLTQWGIPWASLYICYDTSNIIPSFGRSEYNKSSLQVHRPSLCMQFFSWVLDLCLKKRNQTTKTNPKKLNKLKNQTPSPQRQTKQKPKSPKWKTTMPPKKPNRNQTKKPHPLIPSKNVFG